MKTMVIKIELSTAEVKGIKGYLKQELNLNSHTYVQNEQVKEFIDSIVQEELMNGGVAEFIGASMWREENKERRKTK